MRSKDLSIKHMASIWDQAYEKHEPYEIEYRLVLSDGEVRHNHEIGCHLGNVG